MLGRFAATAEIYLSNGGRPPRVGEVLVNGDLANTIRAVAEGGADAFYRSDLTRTMVEGLNNAGALFTEADFAGHYADVGDAISTTYRGHTVYQTRPPSQGFMLLEMLNIVSGHDLSSMTPNSADSIHLLVEAKKIAYSDRNRLAGDPNFVDWPLDGLLSTEYADMRRDQIHPFQAGGEVRPLTPVDGRGDTTYFCVADGEGNAVSWIHSLSNGFGSGVVAPGTGVLFNNRAGRGFSLEPDHPNVIAPGKRTMHTLNCYLTTVGGEVAIVGGTPGGDVQPQVGIQMLTKLIDGGLQPQDAVESPRWHSFPGTDPATINRAGELRVEVGMPDDTIRDLGRMGHNVVQNPLPRVPTTAWCSSSCATGVAGYWPARRIPGATAYLAGGGVLGVREVVNGRQAAVALVEVHAVADHEVVGDGEPDVVVPDLNRGVPGGRVCRAARNSATRPVPGRGCSPSRPRRYGRCPRCRLQSSRAGRRCVPRPAFR